MTLTRMVVGGVCLLYIFSSCNKDNTPAIGEPLLQRVVMAFGDSIEYTEFYYDTLNQLQLIKDSSNSGNPSDITFEYNMEGEPVLIKRLSRSVSTPTGRTDTLLYENGKVIKKINYHSCNIYSYDARGRMISDSLVDRNNNNRTYKYINFAYNDNDDVVQIQEFYDSSGIMTSNVTITSSYNSHINPYSGMGQIFYFITGYYLTLSKHNRTVANYQYPVYFNFNPHTENYIYQYADGLPTRMQIIRNVPGDDRQYTFDFFYY